MKRNATFGATRQPYSFRFAAAFAALACLASSPTGSTAQTISPQAEKLVEVEILSPASVMVGEPLRLKYRITNRRKHPVELKGVGEATRTWVRLELRDSENRTLYTEPMRERPNVVMIRIGPVPPRGATEGTIVAPSRVLPKAPGHYTLRAIVLLPCQQREGDKFIGAARIVRDVIDVQMEVAPANDERLTKVAEGLCQRFLSEKGEAKEAALEALLSMKESAALPVWQSLADDPRLKRDGYGACLFDRGLGELATPAAADLLIRIWGGASLPSDPGAEGVLQELYRTTTDTSLKTHIRKVFEAVGGSPTDLYDGPMKLISTD